MTKAGKRILLTAALLICVSFLCSFLFIAEHADHDCTHTDDCGICRVIECCINTIRGTAAEFTAMSVLIAAVMPFTAAFRAVSAECRAVTLISLRTELRD